MPLTQLARCVVHINGQQTSYLRIGQGPPIVLLVDRFDAAEDTDGVVAALSPHHRLTIPVLPPGDRVAGIRAFLDGIGLLVTHILAGDSWVVPAIAFALSEPERVGRLALFDTATTDHVTADALIDTLADAGHPLFVAQGSGYNNERSGFHVSAAMADALIHFFSGAARGSP